MQVSFAPIVLVVGGVLLLFVIVAIGVYLMVNFRKKNRKQSRLSVEKNLTIDVEKLPIFRPQDFQHVLSVYGVPGRLSALVLAPHGRGAKLPEGPLLRDVVNVILPDFTVVLDEHQPVFRRWDEQLSAHGFVHSFFSNLQLPANHGKGTVWCSIAGKVMTDEGHILAGMIVCCERPNQLGEINIEREGQWHDVIRIEKA